MKKIGKERTAGFSLLEVVVAIAIIGLISAPICSSLILAGRINAHSQAVMEAHLNVRTAVETLMKDGITEASDDYRPGEFRNVKITTEHSSDPYYHVTVKDNHTEPLVTVETYVRAVSPKGGGT
jgi:prepilin-type N-terminal cleavage/methylation domain-containing protein